MIFFTSYAVFGSYAEDFNLAKSQMGPDFNPTTDPQFNWMLQSSLKSIISKVTSQVTPFVDYSKIILCKDCHRANLWRRQIYPDYKMNRDTADHSKDKFNVGKVFQHAYAHIIPSIIGQWNCIKVQCGCAQADDIIAVLTDHLLGQSDQTNVMILTSDRDMIQLCKDRVHLVTAKGQKRDPKEDLQKMTKTILQQQYSAKDFLLFKILIGDSSDNIPNIRRGFGPKTALKYLHDQSSLKKLLLEDKNALESFKRNKKLISMRDIPKDVVDMILQSYEDQKLRQKSYAGQS